MGASATWLPAAWSPRPLLAPPGRPLPQLARVGWRRWLIAAGIVYSLTVAFSSGGVLPTSRVRGGSSVADWLPGGAAGRAGRRSLQEQAAAQQRGGSAVAAAMAMEGWPTDGRKYVTFLVCKGYCNQLMAFADGIAVCYMLNATCVLPKWYRHYDYFAAESQTPTAVAQFDTQARYAVAMDELYDTEHFIRKLSGLVEVVRELPPWLRGDATGAYDDINGVDGTREHTLRPYAEALQRRSVLRLRCTLHSVTWNTQAMGTLRRAIHEALRPSQQLQTLIDQRVERLQAALPTLPSTTLSALGKPSYLAVHIRDESDWHHYCQEEPKNRAVSQVPSFEQCYKSAVEVARTIAQRGLSKGFRAAYVASGNFSAAKATTLLELGGFESVVSEAVTCVRSGTAVHCKEAEVGSEQREVRAAVDFAMMQQAPYFIGNVFSSFSWSIRLVRLFGQCLATDPSTSMYYNMPPSYTLGDLQKEEVLRFTVHAGTIHPAWHGSQLRQYAPRLLQQRKEKCAQGRSVQDCGSVNATALPTVTHIQLTRTGYLDSGYLHAKGWIRTTPGSLEWQPQLQLLVGGRERAVLTANEHRLEGAELEMGRAGFDASIKLHAQDFQSCHVHDWCGVEVQVCTLTTPTLCSDRDTVGLSVPLRRQDDAKPAIIWMFMPGKFRSGGPEALHQLHQEINKLYLDNQVAVRSVFPEGDDFYKGPHSIFVERLKYSYIGPKDYLLVPEHHSVPVPNEYKYVMDEVGAQGLIWHMGQHVSRLEVTTSGKQGFKPICLSPYFARMLECPAKAIINVPMADIFLEMGRMVDQEPSVKEDLILLDYDDRALFDPAQVKLPEGAQLVLLKGYSRSEVLQLYRRAKVYIDSYLTGNERGVFESTLFNMVPIISRHGPALEWHDFPLSQRFKWIYHNYEELSDLVHFALRQYDDALREVRPFKQYIYNMSAIFSESVRTYFQDDVHIMVPLLAEGGATLDNTARSAGIAAALFALIQYPFSTQEAVVDNPYYAEFDAAGTLYHLFSTGLSTSFTTSPLLPEYRRFGRQAAYLQAPDASHIRDFTLILPYGRLPVHPNLAAHLFQAGLQGNWTAVFGPDGTVLARWAEYYPLINRNLWQLPDAFTVEDLQQLLRREGRPYLVLDSVDELAPERQGSIPWRPQHRCRVYTLPVLGRVPRERCFCRDFLQITRHDLWAGSLQKFQQGDEVARWLAEVQESCGGMASE